MKKPRTKKFTPHDITSGFTLVEMMVVLAILGIVVVGVMGVIISQNKNYYSEEELIDMQLNAAVAMDRLTRQIRMAGFGCKDNFKSPKSMTIDGTEYKAVLTHVNNIDSTTAATSDTQEGTDQLTVICALEEVSRVKDDGSNAPYNSKTIHLVTFNDSGGTPFFNPGSDDKKFCYFSPADTQEAFEISSVTAGDSITIGTSVTVNGSDNDFDGDSDPTTPIDTRDQVFRVRAYTYSVRPDNPNPPNIVQKVETLSRTEIAEGIEDLQFQFGWDINGDGVFNPSSSADWNDTITDSNADKVIAIRIIILAITLHPEMKTRDGETFTDLHDDDPSTPNSREYIQADHTITYTASGYKYGPNYHRYRLESIVFIRNLNL